MTSLPTSLEELDEIIATKVNEAVANSTIECTQAIGIARAEEKKAKDELENIRWEAEIYIFLAYMVGADTPPSPPPIPTLWHKDRNLMLRSMYYMLMAIKKKRPELFEDISERPLSHRVWTYLKQFVEI